MQSSAGRPLARCRATVIFYGVDAKVLAACAPIARGLRIARAETSHLRGACSAVDAFPGAMLVVSTALGDAERDAIEAHAASATAKVMWIGPNDDADELVRAIESFAMDPRDEAAEPAPRSLPVDR
jgi:hypothetical protein